MSAQVPLPLGSRPRGLAPSIDRTAPIFWIRSVLLLAELEPGDHHVIRRIELRRGLNILWARPAQEENVRAFDGSLRGHTAGKTTFCRMLRYLLGEPSFGPNDVRERIRKVFPHGWAVGEIVLGGQTWTVARAFSPGAHPVCAVGSAAGLVARTVERRALQDFATALASAVLSPWGIVRLGSSDRDLELGHVLQWLTRDQESRFAGPLEWRHKSSESGAPDLDVADRTAIVRAALALTTDEEQEQARRHTDLLRERKTCEARVPILAHQAEVDRRRLVDRLPGLQGDPPLLWSSASSALKDRQARLTEERVSPDDAELRALHDRSLNASTLARLHRLERQKVVSLLSGVENERDQLSKDAAGEADRAMLASLPSHGLLCDVPLVKARAEGCPLAPKVLADLAVARNQRTAQETLSKQAEEVASLKETYRVLDALFRKSEAEAHNAETVFLRASERRAEGALGNARARAEAASLERDLRLGQESQRAADAVRERIVALDQEIRDSLARQAQLRKRHVASLSKVEDCFDLVVQGLLGPTSYGHVRDEGDDLAFGIEERGDRTSTSLTIIKVLALDLAAITASMEGHGAFPRFLIHDGPREADLDPSVYARLFLFARALEEACTGEPSFQYILTTTTAPPRELQVAPWLIQPVLDASTASGRLLGVDL